MGASSDQMERVQYLVTRLIHLIVTLINLHLDCCLQTNYASLTHKFIIYMYMRIGVSLVLMQNFIIFNIKVYHNEPQLGTKRP